MSIGRPRTGSTPATPLVDSVPRATALAPGVPGGIKAAHVLTEGALCTVE